MEDSVVTVVNRGIPTYKFKFSYFKADFSATIKKGIKVDLGGAFTPVSLQRWWKRRRNFSPSCNESITYNKVYVQLSCFELVIGEKSLSSEIMIRRDRGKATMKSKAVRVKWGEKRWSRVVKEKDCSCFLPVCQCLGHTEERPPHSWLSFQVFQLLRLIN